MGVEFEHHVIAQRERNGSWHIPTVSAPAAQHIRHFGSTPGTVVSSYICAVKQKFRYTHLFPPDYRGYEKYCCRQNRKPPDNNRMSVIEKSITVATQLCGQRAISNAAALWVGPPAVCAITELMRELLAPSPMFNARSNQNSASGI